MDNHELISTSLQKKEVVGKKAVFLRCSIEYSHRRKKNREEDRQRTNTNMKKQRQERYQKKSFVSSRWNAMEKFGSPLKR